MGWLLKDLGFITEGEALELGYSHHGRYYGLPVWLGDIVDIDDWGGPSMTAKCRWLDWLLPVIARVEVAIYQDQCFKILIGKPIDNKKHRQ